MLALKPKEGWVERYKCLARRFQTKIVQCVKVFMLKSQASFEVENFFSSQNITNPLIFLPQTFFKVLFNLILLSFSISISSFRYETIIVRYEWKIVGV